MKTVHIIVATYNEIPHYKNGIHTIFGVNVLMISNIVPKSPNIDFYTPGLQLVRKHAADAQYVIFFPGKPESGAFGLVEVFSDIFAEKKSCLRPAVCPHGLQEKLALLKKYGIPKEQIYTFFDESEHVEILPAIAALLPKQQTIAYFDEEEHCDEMIALFGLMCRCIFRILQV
jgi:hypothetical protein